MMFGASISCNQNVYKLCEKYPIDYEYIMGKGNPLLRKYWGGQLGRVTVIALIMSALTNVPVLLYSGEMSLYLNLTIALVLTLLIFIVPHYMFHRVLERAREELISRILELRSNKGYTRLEDLDRSLGDEQKANGMLNLIYLTQYEGNLRARSTWLVDLEAVVELLVVGSIHVIFMEILTQFAH
jgi:hypothetical protein